MFRTWSASKSLLLWASAAVVGCAAARPGDAPDDRRHPDGIAVDPAEFPPEARESASVSEGVVSLQTPLGPEAAKETTKSFLVALSREDLESLRKVTTPDATSINPATRSRESAFYFFSKRFSRLDYFYLSNVSFWQEERIELYRANEASTLWTDTVGPTATPVVGTPPTMSDALDPADVVVRVPLTTPRTGASQLLGDEMTLLLRRSGGKYVIHRIVEEFSLSP
jgi:hypothetical protein